MTLLKIPLGDSTLCNKKRYYVKNHVPLVEWGTIRRRLAICNSFIHRSSSAFFRSNLLMMKFSRPQRRLPNWSHPRQWNSPLGHQLILVVAICVVLLVFLPQTLVVSVTFFDYLCGRDYASRNVRLFVVCST